MSFKRDGDDFYLLNNLKRRRVSELLSTHIPEDEAILMKNGKFSCIVCSYRPVFDTIDILAVHRKGKKHIAHLSKYLQNKEDIRQLKIKRKHELYLKNGEVNDKTLLKVGPSIEKPKLSHHGLLLSNNYNSCCKKRGRNSLDRKTRIDLHLEKKSIGVAPTVTPSSVSGESSHLESSTINLEIIPPHKLANKAINQYLKTLGRKKSFNKLVNHARNSYTFTKNEEIINTIPKPSRSKNGLIKDISIEQIDPEKIKRTEYYLNLKSLGWKTDNSGNWIKDEDAEFDSDEDQPPPMTP